jgi:hypothetical protein
MLALRPEARPSQALAGWWEHFWFEPASPSNLGLCRLGFFGAIFYLYLGQDFSGWGLVSDVFWMPVYLFQRLRLPVLPSETLALLQVVWKIALLTSCLGLLTRLSTITSFLLGAYLLGLPHNFGKTDHYDAVLVFVFGIMAVSHCGHAWSLDGLLRRAARGRQVDSSSAPPSGEYTWPVRLIWVLFGLVFFAAGLAKLRHAGLAWVGSDNLALLLLAQQYPGVGGALTPWGSLVAQYDWATRTLAALTVALELLYPLAIVRREIRWLVVPATCLMLIGIRVLLGPVFWTFLICQLFWVPWEHVRRWCAKRLARQDRRKLRNTGPIAGRTVERC